jgi:multiple sugar transport system permease protein
VTVTAVSLVVNSMAGYAFAKLRFRGRDRTFRLLSLGLVLPVQVAMLPLFLLMKQLHLINTYWGVIIPGMASIFGIFLIRQYALSIPDDMLDAARIDGASELRIYWEVVVPGILPILATLALAFLATWNDFMWPLIVLSDEAHYTAGGAGDLSGEHAGYGADDGGVGADGYSGFGGVLFLQRYYIQG